MGSPADVDVLYLAATNPGVALVLLAVDVGVDVVVGVADQQQRPTVFVIIARMLHGELGSRGNILKMVLLRTDSPLPCTVELGAVLVQYDEPRAGETPQAPPQRLPHAPPRHAVRP